MHQDSLFFVHVQNWTSRNADLIALLACMPSNNKAHIHRIYGIGPSMTELEQSFAIDLPVYNSANGKLQRILDVMPDDLLLEMEAIWEHRILPAGSVVVEDGHEAGHIGYVLDGILAMVKELPDGHRHIIGLLTPCDMYGRAFNGPSGYRIEAMTEAKVLSCDRVQFERLISRSIEAERRFLLGLLDELDAAREWVIALGGAKVVQRLASFILILSRHKVNGASGKSINIKGQPLNLHIQIKRHDLAHYLGTSQESLSRSFHQLADEKIISINSPYDIDVLDLARLTEISGNALLLERA
jgi:CRP/FNR family transcriptional regulator